jgi:hypothetical protein
VKRELNRSEVVDLELWSAARLIELLPGSSLKWWRRKSSDLVAKGVLKKAGKKWLGSRTAILSALLGGAS